MASQALGPLVWVDQRWRMCEEERKKAYKKRRVKERSCRDRRKAKNRQMMLDVSMGAQSLMV